MRVLSAALIGWSKFFNQSKCQLETIVAKFYARNFLYCGQSYKALYNCNLRL